jgi:hypothetical protein
MKYLLGTLAIAFVLSLLAAAGTNTSRPKAGGDQNAEASRVERAPTGSLPADIPRARAVSHL